MEADAYSAMQDLQARHWWWRGLRRLYRLILRRYLPSGCQTRLILDVGCGGGANFPVLDPLGEVVGIDVSLSALRGLPDRAGRKLVQAHADALPFRAGTFDIISTLAVIEHIERDDGVLAESYRVARPGSLQLLLTSAYMFLWSPHDLANHHCRRYQADQIDRLQESTGWHVLMTSYVVTVVFPAVALVRWLQRRIRRMGPVYDMGSNGWPLKWLLEMFVGAEGWLIAHGIRLPFGVDLISVSRKDA